MTILLSLLFLLTVQQAAPTELGTISGKLRDSRGAPTPGLRVFALPAEAGFAVETLSSIAQTDVEGRYRLEVLPPGRYLIAAGLLDSPSYYPGVASRNQGQSLTVTAGQAIANLDFAIPYSGTSCNSEVYSAAGMSFDAERRLNFQRPSSRTRMSS